MQFSVLNGFHPRERFIWAQEGLTGGAGESSRINSTSAMNVATTLQWNNKVKTPSQAGYLDGGGYCSWGSRPRLSAGGGPLRGFEKKSTSETGFN